MNSQSPVLPDRYLAGAPNFRDIGGATTSQGRVLRHGQLYRSDGLGYLSEDDLVALGRLGIRLVCDLRSERERSKQPSRWPQGPEPEWLLLNILVDLRAGNEQLLELLRRDASVQGARQLMIETYRMLPATLAPGLGQLLRRLADGAGPALIHCTAGKDRTGVVCASILRALGVDHAQIHEDYLLSGERIDKVALTHRSRELLEGLFGLPATPATLEALVGVAPEYLDAAFSSIDETYGSFDAYLERGAGVDAALLQRLGRQFLV